MQPVDGYWAAVFFTNFENPPKKQYKFYYDTCTRGIWSTHLLFHSHHWLCNVYFSFFFKHGGIYYGFASWDIVSRQDTQQQLQQQQRHPPAKAVVPG